ncbi:MAG: transposase-like zinc-binding domain-containing protein [Petrimonas sp.]
MKKCWFCKGSNTIRWGVRNGKQRYRCKDCGALTTWNNKSVSFSILIIQIFQKPQML